MSINGINEINEKYEINECKIILDISELTENKSISFSLNPSKCFSKSMKFNRNFHPFIFHLSSSFPIYFINCDSDYKNTLDPLNVCQILEEKDLKVENSIIIGDDSKITKNNFKKNHLSVNSETDLFDILSFLLINRNELKSNKFEGMNISKYLKRLYFQRNFFNFNWEKNYKEEIKEINSERIYEYETYLKFSKENPFKILKNVFNEYFSILTSIYKNSHE